MTDRIRVFWDSSGIIAAVMATRDDSPGRKLLELGQTGAVDHRVSREVLGDCEQVVRSKNPARVARLALLLSHGNVAITPDPGPETIDQCLYMTGYAPDARVLAAAVECDADLFITYDTEHFLQNPLIGPPDTKLRVMTPGHALAWIRDTLRDAAGK